MTYSSALRSRDYYNLLSFDKDVATVCYRTILRMQCCSVTVCKPPSTSVMLQQRRVMCGWLERQKDPASATYGSTKCCTIHDRLVRRSRTAASWSSWPTTMGRPRRSCHRLRKGRKADCEFAAMRAQDVAKAAIGLPIFKSDRAFNLIKPAFTLGSIPVSQSGEIFRYPGS